MYCNIFVLFFCPHIRTYRHVYVHAVRTYILPLTSLRTCHLHHLCPASLPPSFLTLLTFSILQTKSRLDLSAQTAKQNYQKELDAREEEMDKIRSTMNRRVRSLEAALEEEHSEKQAAVKVRRLHIVWLKNSVQA